MDKKSIWKKLSIIELSNFNLLIILSISFIVLGCNIKSVNQPPPTTIAANPTPPENYFPAMMNDLKLKDVPHYSQEDSRLCNCQYFFGIYENVSSVYRVLTYQTAEAAREAFLAKKNLDRSAEIIKENENEIAAIIKKDGHAQIMFLNGSHILIVAGRKDGTVAIANALPYQAIGTTQPPIRKIEEFAEPPVLLNDLQKAFEKNASEAIEKYTKNYVLLKGKIASVGNNVTTEIINVRPSSTPTPKPTPRRTPRRSSGLSRLINSIFKTPTPTPKPTPTLKPQTREIKKDNWWVRFAVPSPNGGQPLELFCSFRQTIDINKLKEGDEILFRGEVNFADGIVTIDNAEMDFSTPKESK